MISAPKGNYLKRILAIVLFYLINFGLWEVLVKFIPGEWASFTVYVILFIAILILFRKEMLEAWMAFSKRDNKKRFFIELALWLVLDLAFTGLMLLGIQKFGWDILPQNNDNVKEQMAAVPIYLAMIQGCISLLVGVL